MPSTTATTDPGRPPVEPYPPQRFPAAGRSHDARGYRHNEGPTGLARYPTCAAASGGVQV
jgi:hypothetical protein